MEKKEVKGQGDTETAAFENNEITLRTIPYSRDPATSPEYVADDLRIDLVQRGPNQEIGSDFPEGNNRSKSVRRSWLIYSQWKDAVSCFCCKLFLVNTFVICFMWERNQRLQKYISNIMNS